MKTLLKVNTWLPVFSGFYGTVWDGDSTMEMELGYINDVRTQKGMVALDNDESVEWDYDGYNKAVGKGATQWVGERLKDGGFIVAYKYQRVASPREYNFANDSIDVRFTLDADNVRTIARYLTTNKKAFAEYLKERYTSCDGFIAGHSNNPVDWTIALEGTLCDEHKLGAVLDFIARTEGGTDTELIMYEDLTGNGVVVTAKNFDALTDAKEAR